MKRFEYVLLASAPACLAAALTATLTGGVLLGAPPAGDARDLESASVSAPPAQGASSFYVGNREPLEPNPLLKLPIGAIRPAGGLGRQLVLEAEGMFGHLRELSKWCRPEGSAWASPEGKGEFGWEELPYWLKWFVDLAYLTGDPALKAEALSWIEPVLRSQEPDGYFGPRENKAKDDLWPNMPMLNVLESFHDATGDERVLPFLSRYYRWQLSLPRERLLPRSWQKIRGGDNLQSIYWL